MSIDLRDISFPSSPTCGRIARCASPASRLRVAIQFGLKIVRRHGLARRSVSGVPPPILPRVLHRLQAGRLHLPALDQLLRLLRVDLRPDAFRAARRELLQPRRFVIALLLAVYPSVTQRHFERFVVGHGLYAGRLLGQPEPNAGRRRMVFVQPEGPVFLSLEWQNWQFGIRVARGFHFFWHMYYLDNGRARVVRSIKTMPSYSLLKRYSGKASNSSIYCISKP